MNNPSRYNDINICFLFSTIYTKSGAKLHLLIKPTNFLNKNIRICNHIKVKRLFGWLKNGYEIATVPISEFFIVIPYAQNQSHFTNSFSRFYLHLTLTVSTTQSPPLQILQYCQKQLMLHKQKNMLQSKGLCIMRI